MDLSPQLQRSRPTLMVHRATIDLGTDPGSDLNDPATDSGDESLSWRHRGRGRSKVDTSGRGECLIVQEMFDSLKDCCSDTKIYSHVHLEC